MKMNLKINVTRKHEKITIQFVPESTKKKIMTCSHEGLKKGP